MALGGNPVFNGKNFRGATQAPPAPQAYGQAPYGQNAYGQGQHGQAQYGQTQTGWNPAQQGMTQDQLQDYHRPAAGPADTGRMT